MIVKRVFFIYFSIHFTTLLFTSTTGHVRPFISIPCSCHSLRQHPTKEYQYGLEPWIFNQAYYLKLDHAYMREHLTRNPLRKGQMIYRHHEYNDSFEILPFIIYSLFLHTLEERLLNFNQLEILKDAIQLSAGYWTCTKYWDWYPRISVYTIPDIWKPRFLDSIFPKKRF